MRRIHVSLAATPTSPVVSDFKVEDIGNGQFRVSCTQTTGPQISVIRELGQRFAQHIAGNGGKGYAVFTPTGKPFNYSFKGNKLVVQAPKDKILAEIEERCADWS